MPLEFFRRYPSVLLQRYEYTLATPLDSDGIEIVADAGRAKLLESRVDAMVLDLSGRVRSPFALERIVAPRASRVRVTDSDEVQSDQVRTYCYCDAIADINGDLAAGIYFPTPTFPPLLFRLGRAVKVRVSVPDDDFFDHHPGVAVSTQHLALLREQRVIAIELWGVALTDDIYRSLTTSVSDEERAKRMEVVWKKHLAGETVTLDEFLSKRRS